MLALTSECVMAEAEKLISKPLKPWMIAVCDLRAQAERMIETVKDHPDFHKYTTQFVVEQLAIRLASLATEANLKAALKARK